MRIENVEFCIGGEIRKLTISELMLFDNKLWQKVINKITEKELESEMIRKLSEPNYRIGFVLKIISGEYEISPPWTAQIPKDDGTFRTVYVNSDVDRVVLTMFNQILNECFSFMIHPNCKSYQEEIGIQKIVSEIPQKINNAFQLYGTYRGFICGYKTDFSKYFDSVLIARIMEVFDYIERYEHVKENVIISILRKYYKSDVYYETKKDFELDINAKHKYQSLKQGCAVASFLANVLLYELDEFMTKKYLIYYRYSDDCLILDKNHFEIINDINEHISKFGIILNPKKIQPIKFNQWFTFLGFNINLERQEITLSKKWIDSFELKLKNATFKNKNCTIDKATKNVLRLLYCGEYSWIRAVYIINNENDIDELNKYAMDCIRACKNHKTKIGGLGSTKTLYDRTIPKRFGKQVGTIRKETEKEIENYISIRNAINNLKNGTLDALIADLLKDF